jgi:hypothetical protein
MNICSVKVREVGRYSHDILCLGCQAKTKRISAECVLRPGFDSTKLGCGSNPAENQGLGYQAKTKRISEGWVLRPGSGLAKLGFG